MTPIHYTTTDLYLAAWLMMQGAKLQGITKLSQFASTLTFTHPKILDVVNDFNACEPVTFSVKSFGEIRNEIKRLIKMQPQS